MIPVLAPILWVCPNCDTVAQAAPFPGRFHNCRGLRGLTAPMLPEGVRAKVEAHEREDYIGSEAVQTDGAGRPVYMVQTTRDDGTDAIVFPPTARVGVST